jgi:cob(I)alamin adenosyltransferase
MGSKIYTRRGDQGDTSLADESRVPKDSPRVAAYGAIDEANSWIGVARTEVDDETLDGALEFLQHRFFYCSSNIATPTGAGIEPTRIAEADVATLERMIDRFEERTGPISQFILPGGTKAAAYLHVARTVCRRAERALVTLARTEAVDPLVRKFINRSSDALFAAARYANRLAGRDDVVWNKDLPRPDEPSR